MDNYWADTTAEAITAALESKGPAEVREMIGKLLFLAAGFVRGVYRLEI